MHGVLGFWGLLIYFRPFSIKVLENSIKIVKETHFKGFYLKWEKIMQQFF